MFLIIIKTCSGSRTKCQLSKLLTPEQKTKYEQLKQDEKAKWQQGGAYRVNGGGE